LSATVAVGPDRRLRVSQAGLESKGDAKDGGGEDVVITLSGATESTRV
jgi:hypothetical protein